MRYHAETKCRRCGFSSSSFVARTLWASSEGPWNLRLLLPTMGILTCTTCHLSRSLDCQMRRNRRTTFDHIDMSTTSLNDVAWIELLYFALSSYRPTSNTPPPEPYSHTYAIHPSQFSTPSGSICILSYVHLVHESWTRAKLPKYCLASCRKFPIMLWRPALEHLLLVSNSQAHRRPRLASNIFLRSSAGCRWAREIVNAQAPVVRDRGKFPTTDRNYMRAAGRTSY